MLGSGTALRTYSQTRLRSIPSAQVAFFQQNRQLKSTHMASASVLQDDIPNNAQPLNVLGTALEQHSVSPMTGYFRDGYCRTGEYDPHLPIRSLRFAF
ncbi:hypothetical protein ACGC1H_002860 [Rhizoctonia solani]